VGRDDGIRKEFVFFIEGASDDEEIGFDEGRIAEEHLCVPKDIFEEIGTTAEVTFGTLLDEIGKLVLLITEETIFGPFVIPLGEGFWRGVLF
jgi:hypothetical protein